jgi:hypothetical protein
VRSRSVLSVVEKWSKVSYMLHEVFTGSIVHDSNTTGSDFSQEKTQCARSQSLEGNSELNKAVTVMMIFFLVGSSSLVFNIQPARAYPKTWIH